MMVVVMLPFLSFFNLIFFLWRPPPHSCPLSLFAVPLAETVRGFKHNLTSSKGQFSHSAWPRALGTKAPQFTSFNWALAFVPAERGAWSGGHQTSPSWSARSGAAKRLAPASLWRMQPCHVTVPPPHSPPCPEHTITMCHIKHHWAPLRETEMAAKRKMICDRWPFATVQCVLPDRCASCYGVSQRFECTRHVLLLY